MKQISAINDFVIKFANVNGSGSASANELFAKAILRMGVPVSPRNIFPSNIQGLPTWYEVRISEKGYLGRRGGIDMMVAMNPQTWAADVEEIAPGGYLFYDSTRPRAAFGALTLHRNPARAGVLIAGGIGITPFMSMLRHAAHQQMPQDLLLLYSNPAWTRGRDRPAARARKTTVTDGKRRLDRHGLRPRDDGDGQGDRGHAHLRGDRRRWPAAPGAAARDLKKITFQRPPDKRQQLYYL